MNDRARLAITLFLLALAVLFGLTLAGYFSGVWEVDHLKTYDP